MGEPPAPVPDDRLRQDLAEVNDLVEAGVEVDGEVQVESSTWVVYGHTSYDGEVVVGMYHEEVEAIEVVHRAPHPHQGPRRPPFPPRPHERTVMQLTVIGGTGLIGSKLVALLRDQGHEVVVAAPATGVNTLTGEGLAEAFAGADVVVDVSNSPSFEAAAVLEFFETSTRNILAAEADAGVGHHVALSVVGTQRLAGSGYFRGKIAQERLITEGEIPYSIVHATQFFEFVGGLADMHTVDGAVRLAPVLFQPMAADDVAAAVGRVAVGPPVGGVVEVGGPEQFRLDELIRRALAERQDPREVVTDPAAPYSGAPVTERTLVPDEGALLGETRYDDWRARQA